MLRKILLWAAYAFFIAIASIVLNQADRFLFQQPFTYHLTAKIEDHEVGVEDAGHDGTPFCSFMIFFSTEGLKYKGTEYFNNEPALEKCRELKNGDVVELRILTEGHGKGEHQVAAYWRLGDVSGPLVYPFGF